MLVYHKNTLMSNYFCFFALGYNDPENFWTGLGFLED